MTYGFLSAANAGAVATPRIALPRHVASITCFIMIGFPPTGTGVAPSGAFDTVTI
jgi:hypothetical protein